MEKKAQLQNLRDIQITSCGLSDSEISKQRLIFGENIIVERVGNPWLELVFDTLKDPMVWFLITIASVFYFVGDIYESIILYTATIPLVFMDAFLHWRTQASTSSLRSQLSSSVIVIRENRKVSIDSNDIVPGDLVILSTKNHFLPADGIWEECDSLQVDESVLTGEAFPVNKSSIGKDTLLKQKESLVDSTFLGFAGTRVLTGNGHLRVLAIGKKTSYGEIIHSVTDITHERTPLQQAILELTRNLVYLALLFCFVLAGVRLYQGHGWLDALLSAGVLAVAAIPEEFPIVFTFFLGVGVYRLAKHHVLVRRAVSVENIGRVTQICTDKTGTITIGKLTLTHLETTEETSEQDLLRFSMAASNADGNDPVDIAIFDMSKKRSVKMPLKLKSIPFTEDRKREVAFLEGNDKSQLCVIKGAPEVILSKSNLSSVDLDLWTKEVSTLAKGGHKVLAVAVKEIIETTSFIEPDSDFRFIGLLAFEDPARPEVKDSIIYCQENGIKVLMITGDHPDTASAIAKDIGLKKESPLVITAHNLDWSQEEIRSLKNIDVVARCSPLEKLKIVKSLKKSGELVVVTGDGVNDVPALKAADIGIAMGLRGSRSAKEVASIILSDDNFSTIVNAIREGRQLFENLRMSFKYLLLIHIPFILSAAIIPLIGYPLLFLPIHVVWLELIIHPSALFAFQLKSNGKPIKIKGARNSFFSKRESATILIIGIIFTLVLIYSYRNGFFENQNIQHARSKAMALLSFWSAGVVLFLTKGRTVAARIIVFMTMAFSIVLIQNTWFAEILHLSPLHLSDWGGVIGSLSAMLLLFLFLNKRSMVR
ncbi:MULTISPECIES: cation-translocating P-type ATPase [unclassified Halobacteriovorax]|uniref:cation-translocating P-type ATPase n=1 Tax=unclassified Halobacteriovorax TaxID=2639665 RepID=UPI002FEED26C